MIQKEIKIECEKERASQRRSKKETGSTEKKENERERARESLTRERVELVVP